MKLVMTKQRKEIIDIISNTNKPLSLKEIYANIKDKQLNITTIYRTIEFLLNNGVIKLIHINKTDYYYSNKFPHHYVVCLNCNKFINIPCKDSDIIKTNIPNFTVESHDLILYGRCKKCL